MLDASELPSADCAITILHARGRLLAKLIRTDGSIDSYDKAKHFDAIELGIQGLDHLAAVVRSLLPCWDRCVVRGSLVGGSPATGIRRLLHADRETGDQPAFYELPRRWVAIDVDGIPRPPEIPVADIACCARVAISHLPPEFQGRACVAVASGGHGFKPGIRMRLWYWLDGAATYAVLREWLFASPIDLATLRAVQPIYTAAPVLGDGVIDPVPDRLAVLPGAPLVTIRPLPPPQPRQATAAPGRVGQAGQAPRSASSGDF